VIAITLFQNEGVPSSYPSVSSYGLSAAAAALNPNMIWQRIESYVVYRWSSRSIVWIAQGSGDWQPPLAPATIGLVERWENNAWTADTTLLPSVLGGYELPS
jgi:hypothetical protein